MADVDAVLVTKRAEDGSIVEVEVRRSDHPMFQPFAELLSRSDETTKIVVHHVSGMTVTAEPFREDHRAETTSVEHDPLGPDSGGDQ